MKNAVLEMIEREAPEGVSINTRHTLFYDNVPGFEEKDAEALIEKFETVLPGFKLEGVVEVQGVSIGYKTLVDPGGKIEISIHYLAKED